VNRYRFCQQVEKDLEDIWIYLGEQDEIAADRQLAQQLYRFPMLVQFPNMGRQRNELLTRFRSFPVKPYINFLHNSPRESRDCESPASIAGYRRTILAIAPKLPCSPRPKSSCKKKIYFCKKFTGITDSIA
jgi:toxin ParE1/3/4